MSRPTIADLSPRHQAEVARQLASGKPLGLARAQAIREVEVDFKPAPKPPKKRLRQRALPKLNKLEAEFSAWLKDAYRSAHVHEQAFRLELANGCTYTPDVVLVLTDTDGLPVRVHVYEVKGPFAREDGLIKLKVAARVYPWIRFSLASKARGGWSFEEVRP